ncbi:MAG TPA: hypothetical protein VFS21_03945 [Roseiflexaceae bacterium]|nr:hypothetical protein [Roseiflexaceae bacterium]
MTVRNPRPRLRPSLSALTLLAVVLTAASYVLLPARVGHATIARIMPRMQWASEEPLGSQAVFARAGSTLYMGGKLPGLGDSNAFGLVDHATGQPIYGLPPLAGTVWASVSDGQGGWFVRGEFAVVSAPGFANLVRIKADRTLDTAWNPHAAPGRCLARNATTVFVGSAAVDIASGRQLAWQYGEPDPSYAESCPIVSTNDLVLLGWGSGVLALDARTGAPRWTVNLPVAGRIHAMALHGTTLYVSAEYPAAIRAIDIARQRLLPFHLYLGEPYCTPGSEVPICYPPPLVDRLAVLNNTLYLSGYFGEINGTDVSSTAAVNLPSGTVLPWNPRGGQVVGAWSDRIYLRGTEYLYNGARWQDYIEAVHPVSGASLWYRGKFTATIKNGSPSGAGLLLGGRGFVRTSTGPNLAALDFPSGAPQDWRPLPNGPITQLAASDSAVYVAGMFSQIGGQPRAGLAAFDHPSGALRAWNPQLNGPVSTLLLGHGRVYVAGAFSQADGQPRPGLAAFDQTTGALLDWTPSGLPAWSVTDLVASDGALYVALEDAVENASGRHNAALVALDQATGAPTGWTTTFEVWFLNDLAVYGSDLYVSGWLFSGEEVKLLVFDTRGGTTPKASFPGRLRGFTMVIHDQTLYHGTSEGVDLLDLDTITPLLWWYEWAGRGAQLADAGSDLVILTNNRLFAYPYSPQALVRTEPATQLTRTSATLNGRLNPNGSPTTAFFQITSKLGSCDAFWTIPVSGVFTGTLDLPLSVPATQLTPSVVYHYRLVVVNAYGVSYGAKNHFMLFNADPPAGAAPATPPSAGDSGPAPAEATATPGWQIFLPGLRRCPTDGF